MSRTFGPIVRRYIDEELQLKAEIPSLRIGDSGVLSGGEVSGKGLFARVRTKASSPLDT
jgi:L-aminoadipate-semialdehyde dehydrogenase